MMMIMQLNIVGTMNCRIMGERTVKIVHFSFELIKKRVSIYFSHSTLSVLYFCAATSVFRTTVNYIVILN